MRSLHGETVVVTGAAGGFGRALTRQLLAEGCRLVLADLDRARVEEAAASSAAPGAPGRVLGCIGADLADPAGADALHAEAMRLAPEVDMLVNNAGVNVLGLLPDVPREKWERLLQVNLLAPIRLTALFLPGMIARRKGHVVNVCSVAGLVGAREMTAYSASKFGLRGFGEALAEDVRGFGVRVTNVYPFYSRTPILECERYGRVDLTRVPARLVYDPEYVMAKAIRGIRQGKLHVFPGAMTRQIDVVRRFAPWLRPVLERL
ncbi:MAG TPA: SDR family NAD(P)-dependent oxidoreductase, partial [Longimicrobiaceae bacterium]|nr:SDR family NAD(P)-dependent oxidoreductase [Longimicrobiaceae bacterium]